MEIVHHTRSIRVAPRKMRLVIDQIRHQKAEAAVILLPLVAKRGAENVHKSLKAAIQAAEDANLDRTTLTIQRIYCDEGPALKRMMKHSRGRSAMIMKKMSHLSIVLSGEPRTKAKRVRAKAAEAQVTEPVAAEPTEKE